MHESISEVTKVDPLEKNGGKSTKFIRSLQNCLPSWLVFFFFLFFFFFFFFFFVFFLFFVLFFFFLSFLISALSIFETECIRFRKTDFRKTDFSQKSTTEWKLVYIHMTWLVSSRLIWIYTVCTCIWFWSTQLKNLNGTRLVAKWNPAEGSENNVSVHIPCWKFKKNNDWNMQRINQKSKMSEIILTAPCTKLSSGKCGQRRPDQPAHPRRLIRAFTVR